MSKTWDKLSAQDRVIAVHVDFSNNKGEVVYFHKILG